MTGTDTTPTKETTLCDLFRRWRKRRHCMHHDRLTGQSWIKSMLVDLGMNKIFWCDRCGKGF